MNFKDAVKHDLDHVFFNAEEFGEPTLINDNSTIIVYDTDSLAKLDYNNAKLAKTELVINVKAEFFDYKLPQSNKQLKLGQKMYRITFSDVYLGMYRIGLESVSG